jgi:hypothetical protein
LEVIKDLVRVIVDPSVPLVLEVNLEAWGLEERRTPLSSEIASDVRRYALAALQNYIFSFLEHEGMENGEVRAIRSQDMEGIMTVARGLFDSLPQTTGLMVFPSILHFLADCLLLVDGDVEGEFVGQVCSTAFEIAADPRWSPVEACQVLERLCRRPAFAELAVGRVRPVFSNLLSGSRPEWREACFRFGWVLADAGLEERVLQEFPWEELAAYLASDESEEAPQIAFALVVAELHNEGFPERFAAAGAANRLNVILGEGTFAVKEAAIRALCVLCNSLPGVRVFELIGDGFLEKCAEGWAGLNDPLYAIQAVTLVLSRVSQLPADARARVALEIERSRIIEEIEAVNREFTEVGGTRDDEAIEALRGVCARIRSGLG